MKHPIPPPPDELVDQWRKDNLVPENLANYVATLAARWGADQELEACCDHLRDHQWGFVQRPDGSKIHRAVYLKEARRPKPPSLKEQALDRCNDYIDPDGIIRLALQQLP